LARLNLFQRLKRGFEQEKRLNQARIATDKDRKIVVRQVI